MNMAISPFVFYISLAIILDVVAVIVARYWTLTNTSWLLYLVVLLYAGVGYCFAKSLQYEGMAVSYIVWVTVVAVLITVIGHFIFKEKLEVTQLVGVFLAVVAVFLVNSK